ncbi:MAG: endonuclease/exonuclease/phosphatase family protein, partial [Reyranella sp.]|uniref:endonuclease/exonuclease/phosphatase family protein n=1 Tax=Reyranella sp. TaxID=1929291 RepID=UPI003D121EDA
MTDDRVLTAFQRTLEFGRIYAKQPRQPLADITPGRPVRILTWNIGRGFAPERIADTIRELQPDIACLQEVDWGNRRTGARDVLQILADGTGMLGLYGIEFLEVQGPGRPRRLAGGGATGNALLCRTDPRVCFRIELLPAIDWEHGAEDGKLPRRVRARVRRERRIGRRFALAAELDVGGARIVVASVHFEDKLGGPCGRFRHFRSVVEAIDARRGDSDATVVVAGDFNTFDSAVARLVTPDTDATALGRPRGTSEAAWWKRALLPPTGFADPFPAAAWT